MISEKFNSRDTIPLSSQIQGGIYFYFCLIDSMIEIIFQAKISTIDMLHHIELKLESLTREQEHLNKEKVDLARVECEKERRHRNII